MNKNIKLVVYLAVVLVVVWFGYKWWISSNQVDLQQELTGLEDVEAMVDNEVVYTDEGFSPNMIKVKVGDTVSFVNDSSNEMWVASAQHPTHEVLPEFDQLEEGGDYEYTFTEVGEWKYHNHLNPKDFGSVVVE